MYCKYAATIRFTSSCEERSTLDSGAWKIPRVRFLIGLALYSGASLKLELITNSIIQHEASSFVSIKGIVISFLSLQSLDLNIRSNCTSPDIIQEIAAPSRSNEHNTRWCTRWLSHHTFQSIGFFPNAINASSARLKHRDVRNGDADFVAPSGLGCEYRKGNNVEHCNVPPLEWIFIERSDRTLVAKFLSYYLLRGRGGLPLDGLCVLLCACYRTSSFPCYAACSLIRPMVAHGCWLPPSMRDDAVNTSAPR